MAQDRLVLAESRDGLRSSSGACTPDGEMASAFNSWTWSTEWVKAHGKSRSMLLTQQHYIIDDDHRMMRG